MAGPAFLFVDLPIEHANQAGLPAELAALARREGGEVFAHAPAGRVAGLEPGTVAAGVVLVRWRDAERLRAVARSVILPALGAALPSGARPTVLAAESLPDEGLPSMMDIPTAASVPRPPATPRNTFLVIRGTAWDPARLDHYRDVILPMHKERGGYYEAFCVAPGQVEALSGDWRDAIFAISRWPRRDLAEDFWYCDRYQRGAIPLRVGAGRFTVQLVEAAHP